MADQTEMVKLILDVIGVKSVQELKDELKLTQTSMKGLISSWDQGNITSEKLKSEMEELTFRTKAYNQALAQAQAEAMRSTMTTEQQILSNIRIDTSMTAIGRTADRVGAKMGRRGDLGQGMMQLGYLVDDIQYGFKGIINNIPQVALALGGSAGLVGVIGIVSVGAYQLYNNFDAISRKLSGAATNEIPAAANALKVLETSTAKAKDRMKELETAGKVTSAELNEYTKLRIKVAEAEERIEKAQKAQSVIKAQESSKTPEEEELGGAFNKSIAGYGKRFGKDLTEAVAAPQLVVALKDRDAIMKHPQATAQHKKEAQAFYLDEIANIKKSSKIQADELRSGAGQGEVADIDFIANLVQNDTGKKRFQKGVGGEVIKLSTKNRAAGKKMDKVQENAEKDAEELVDYNKWLAQGKINSDDAMAQHIKDLGSKEATNRLAARDRDNANAGKDKGIPKFRGAVNSKGQQGDSIYVSDVQDMKNLAAQVQAQQGGSNDEALNIAMDIMRDMLAGSAKNGRLTAQQMQSLMQIKSVAKAQIDSMDRMMNPMNPSFLGFGQ